MSKPKYVKPTLTSVGLPIKRAQGFETEGYCTSGNSAGIAGGTCGSGINPEAPMTDDCDYGEGATLSCPTGNLAGLGFVDGCNNGNTIYGGAPCTAGSNN